MSEYATRISHPLPGRPFSLNGIQILSIIVPLAFPVCLLVYFNFFTISGVIRNRKRSYQEPLLLAASYVRIFTERFIHLE